MNYYTPIHHIEYVSKYHDRRCADRVIFYGKKPIDPFPKLNTIKENIEPEYFEHSEEFMQDALEFLHESEYFYNNCVEKNFECITVLIS